MFCCNLSEVIDISVLFALTKRYLLTLLHVAIDDILSQLRGVVLAFITSASNNRLVFEECTAHKSLHRQGSEYIKIINFHV